MPLGKPVTVEAVDGARAFRRRLLEMGLVPGTVVRVVTIAPLGDPLRIEVRHGQWSIRRAEAAQIGIERLDPERALAQVALQPLAAVSTEPTAVTAGSVAASTTAVTAGSVATGVAVPAI